MTTLKPNDLQDLLTRKGFSVGEAGSDGIWGSDTAHACEAWFALGTDLYSSGSEPDIKPGIIPVSWLPDVDMDRIINHWTAGGYQVSLTDKEHYHIIIDGNGKLVRGDNSIKANVSTNDADGYAAHTYQCNTKSIGVSCAAMLGAVEVPFNPGPYPLKEIQWLTQAQVNAELCKKYKIKVTKTTVLQHGEVQKNLGIAQKGKWDINKLPWLPNMTPAQVGDAFRDEVAKRLSQL